MVEEKSFCCPLCGSEKFFTSWGDDGIIGPGGRRWVEYYWCDGCSVMFRDPEKFGTVKLPNGHRPVRYRG